MNKRNKLILVCIIEILIILFIIFLFLKFDINVLKVTDLYENNNISAISNDNNVYNFSSPNLILNNSLKKVDYSTLSENDVIFVLSSPPNFVPSVGFYNIYGQQVNKIYGVNLVIILKDN